MATKPDWEQLLRRPDFLADEASAGAWFDRIAARLLNGCRLVAAGRAHRLVEVEFYYYGNGHPDPFTHRDPLQRSCGRWYFHRTRGAYRGGSFKGLDLTFGDGDVFGGVLLRGLETPEGDLVDGPSLLVDRLLAVTGAGGVAALAVAVDGRPAWGAANPLRLVELVDEESRPIHRSARVGLSLKKASAGGDMPRYILRPYRSLTEPRRTGKGKPLLVLALHARGVDVDAIHRLTGCPQATIRRYLADYEAGRQEADFACYVGRDLAPGDLCRLHGTGHALGHG